jgi:N-methylhydantoinase A/oxoprolinase/acetone carboxylase beta subunit
MELQRWADCRYAGQGYELRVEAPSGVVDAGWSAAVRDAFEARHEREYFGRFPDLGVQLVTVRVTGVGRMPAVHWPGLQQRDDGSAPAPRLEHGVVFPVDGGAERVPTQVLQRAALRSGDELAGPAVIEQPDSTILVPPGARARVDQIGNVILEVSQ